MYDDLPEELLYLTSGLDIVNEPRFIDARQFDAFMSSEITADNIESLGEVYLEIDRRQDVERISKWYYSIPPEERWSRCGREVIYLFSAFDKLAKRRVKPFSSRRLAWTGRQSNPNWRNVPRLLEFLIEPGRKYGSYQSEQDVYELLSRMTEDERLELVSVGEKLKDEGVRAVLTAWLEAHPISDYEEAALIYFLIGILHAADISIE